ncbi:MAG: amidohydrolase family protein, partial [Planctomycetota bacterium]
VEGFQKMLRFTLLCHQAGVPVVASSHGNPPVCEEGWAMQHEMRLLHEAGLSPLEVITAATLEPAKFFRCEDRLGSIEVGKHADLVLYEGKPHEDLDDLWKVAKVMQAGRWVKP